MDSEAEKCGSVKKNSHFFYCLITKVWFKRGIVFNWNYMYLTREWDKPQKSMIYADLDHEFET